MITLLLLLSPEEIFLRIRLEALEDGERAKALFEESSEELPDSLKLMLSSALGMDGDSLLMHFVNSGSREPYIWKVFLYKKFVESKGDLEGFDRVVGKYIHGFDSIPDVLLFAGKIYENLGDIKKALHFYKRAMFLGETEEAPRHILVIYAKMGRCDSTLPVVRKNLKVPEDPHERRRLYLAMGMCYERSNEKRKALELYKKAYEIKKDTVLGFKIAKLLSDLGSTEALSFLAAMYEDFGFTRPNLYWGYALISSGSEFRIEEGIREISHYLAERGDDAEARNLLMHAFLKLGDTSTALYHAKRAYDLAPGDDDYRITYAFLLSSITNNHRRFGWLLRERDRENPLGKWVWARFHRYRGERSSAIALYRQLVRMDPANVPLNLEAYWYAMGVGEHRFAGEVMRGLVERYPDSIAFWINLAEVYTLLNLPDSISNLYSEKLKRYGYKLKDCELATVYNNWAYAFALLNHKLDSAEVLVDKAYSLCEMDHILDTKGWIMFLTGRYDRAKEYVRRAIKNMRDGDIKLPEVYLHYLLIRCATGEGINPLLLKEIEGMMARDRLRLYRKYLKMCRERRL